VRPFRRSDVDFHSTLAQELGDGGAEGVHPGADRTPFTEPARVPEPWPPPDEGTPPDRNQLIASKIPGARYVELEGGDNMFSLGDSEALIDEEAFARDEEIDVMEACRRVDEIATLASRAKGAVAGFNQVMTAIAGHFADGAGPARMVEFAAQESGYLAELEEDREEYRHRLKRKEEAWASLESAQAEVERLAGDRIGSAAITGAWRSVIASPLRSASVTGVRSGLLITCRSSALKRFMVIESASSASRWANRRSSVRPRWSASLGPVLAVSGTGMCPTLLAGAQHPAERLKPGL
jgi:hypothetical protein